MAVLGLEGRCLHASCAVRSVREGFNRLVRGATRAQAMLV